MFHVYHLYRYITVTGMFYVVVSVWWLNTVPLFPLQTWIEGSYSPLTVFGDNTTFLLMCVNRLLLLFHHLLPAFSIVFLVLDTWQRRFKLTLAHAANMEKIPEEIPTGKCCCCETMMFSPHWPDIVPLLCPCLLSEGSVLSELQGHWGHAGSRWYLWFWNWS